MLDRSQGPIIVLKYRFFYKQNTVQSMKILRSEAADKSLGVFFDAEFDFNGPGTPGAIK